MDRLLSQFASWKSKEIELVLVDDCSTDDTYFSLCEYKKKWAELNVQVMQNGENSGPGYSRNSAIKVANGKYITFLDSDDYFEEDFIATVIDALQSNPDCVVFDAFIRYKDGSKRYWPLIRNERFKGGEMNVRDVMMNILPGTWGKVYSRDVILKNDVKFFNQFQGEDVPFTLHAVSCCKKIIYIKKPVYNYVQHSSSLIHNNTMKGPERHINTFAYLEGKLQDRFPIETEALFIKNKLVPIAMSAVREMGRTDFIQLVKKQEESYPNYISNRYIKDMPTYMRFLVFFTNHKCYYCLKFVTLLQKYRFRILYKTK